MKEVICGIEQNTACVIYTWVVTSDLLGSVLLLLPVFFCLTGNSLVLVLLPGNPQIHPQCDVQVSFSIQTNWRPLWKTQLFNCDIERTWKLLPVRAEYLLGESDTRVHRPVKLSVHFVPHTPDTFQCMLCSLTEHFSNSRHWLDLHNQMCECDCKHTRPDVHPGNQHYSNWWELWYL